MLLRQNMDVLLQQLPLRIETEMVSVRIALHEKWSLFNRIDAGFTIEINLIQRKDLVGIHQ
jgi:hypothetical protein